MALLRTIFLRCLTTAVTLLDTQSANRAVTLDSQAILDLPTNARNPFALVHINAGVIAVRTGISQATQDQNHNRFSMNGGRGQAGLACPFLSPVR